MGAEPTRRTHRKERILILADVDIYNSIMDGQIGITPFNDNQLQPASYDVRLGDRFISYPRIKGSVVPGVTTLDGAETTGP